MLVLALFACTGGTPEPQAPEPDAPAPTEAPAPADVVEEADPGDPLAAVIAAGGCAQAEPDTQPQNVEVHTVGDKSYWVVTCEMFAYQGTFEVWDADAGAPVMNGESRLGGLGLPTLDAEAGTVTWLAKARGPGDCGDWYRHDLSGALQEHRSRSCQDTAPDTIDPSAWPQIGPPMEGTITAVENGDVACYLQLEGETDMRMANFDLCSDDHIGKRVRLEFSLQSVMGPTCEGDPDCTDSEEVALVSALTVIE